jgi:hypothetical protein
MQRLPDVLAQLRSRYRAELDSEDLVTRLVAREQLERLSIGARRARRALQPTDERAVVSGQAPRRWAFALEDLIARAGNPRIREHADGSYDCGHQPAHASASERCLWVVPSEGRWWCRSCLRHGDAIAWLMAERGCAFGVAYAELHTRYGPPFRKEA